jgi:multidrug efflux pump subunit AcrA (membrane-fusion protein)
VSGARRAAFAAAVLALGLACGRGGGDAADATDAAVSGGGAIPHATPVGVAAVELATLVAEVSAPGQTVALVEQKVRAPFDGTVTALDVVEGNQVNRGQRIGEMVARDSEAALFGAREMVRQAGTEAERAAARRAVELAEQNRVAAPLIATVSGRVTARTAAAGDRVTADQELLTIADAESVVFRADVPQAELAAVRPGQSAAVEISGGAAPLAARVRGFLSPAQKTDLTIPLRLDFARPEAVPAVGLFGVARIVVGEHRGVPVVPRAAVLRDDISGSSRVGTVDAAHRLRWVEVETGLSDAARVEIVSPPLAAGTPVVTSGQVGLADGTPVTIEP